jgi:hypothetical protein
LRLRTPSSDIELVSRHRPDGSVRPVSVDRRVQAGARPICSPASGLCRACGLPHAGVRPVAIEHTAERERASDFCHASAWHHHLLSGRSEALSSPLADACDAGASHDRGPETEPMAARLQVQHGFIRRRQPVGQEVHQ